MKKKLLICICTLALALGLVACSKEEPTYGGYKAEQFEGVLQSYMYQLESIGSADIEQLVASAESNDNDMYATLFRDWGNCVDLKGEFISFKDFTCDKSGRTLTCTLTADYSNRDLKLIFVYNVNHIDNGPTAMNVEPVYTLGETMQKAALNTVMGILIVFCMLVVMSLVIKCFEFIPAIEKAFKKKETTTVVEPVKAETTPVAAEDDLALIAVISAAIAASTGASTDSFVVRSIKRRY